MAIPTDEIQHLAALTHLGLTDGEAEKLAGDVTNILGHVDRLQALNTDHIAPTAQVIPLGDVLRDDEPRPSLTAHEALNNAPERDDNFFVVPAVFGD